MSASVLPQRRVVVAEPADPVGVQLAVLLDDDSFEVVGHTHQAQAAVALTAALSPDFIIVDLAASPPDQQGADGDAITAAAIAGQQVPAVIVLAPSADRETVSRIVTAGAAAIVRRPLTKPRCYRPSRSPSHATHRQPHCERS